MSLFVIFIVTPSLAQHSIPLDLPLEMPNNCLAHPDPPSVVQVDHVPGWPRLPPLRELVRLYGGEGTPSKSSSRRPHPKPMEGRGADSAILVVEKFDPRV